MLNVRLSAISDMASKLASRLYKQVGAQSHCHPNPLMVVGEPVATGPATVPPRPITVSGGFSNRVEMDSMSSNPFISMKRWVVKSVEQCGQELFELTHCSTHCSHPTTTPWQHVDMTGFLCGALTDNTVKNIGEGHHKLEVVLQYANTCVDLV